MMKKTGIIIILTSIVLLISCNRQTERVALTPNISVVLPVNYKTINDVKKAKGTSYIARYHNDEIFVSKLILKEIDKLSLEDKKELIKTNLFSFMKPLNGINLISSEEEIGDILQNNFSFEQNRKDSSFIVFGKLILEDTNFLMISYKTMNPISNSSANDKERFIKSMKYKQ